MKVSSRVATGALIVASAMLSLTGCVVHDKEVVHDNAGYQQGYKEGYYDRDHNRYWHDWVARLRSERPLLPLICLKPALEAGIPAAPSGIGMCPKGRFSQR